MDSQSNPFPSFVEAIAKRFNLPGISLGILSHRREGDARRAVIKHLRNGTGVSFSMYNNSVARCFHLCYSDCNVTWCRKNLCRKRDTMKKNGHYCKVCGRYRANEKFTGKGHATHICKDCAKLPPEEKAKQEALNRLFNLPLYLSKEQKAWLKNRMQDRRPEVKALAQEQYDMRFGRRHQEM